MNKIECILADEQLQTLELEMLKVFHSVCEEHNLRYFLIGGTLLGAVRHGGFIPWDDDIDVGMPRTDYEILLNNANEWFPQKFRLAHWKNTEQYVYSFAKLENQNSILVEDAYKHLTKRNAGVYIDIFPFDGMPSNRIKQLLWYAFVRSINRLSILMYCSTNFAESYKNIKKLGKAIFGKIFQALFSPKKVHAFYEKFMQKYSFESSEYVINHSGMWGLRELFPKPIFNSLQIV